MFSYILKIFFLHFFLYIVMIWQGNNRTFCKFCYASMLKCLYSITINPAFVPRSTRTCEMLFTDSLWIKCIWRNENNNSLHLSERYSAEFKQTIEINEQPTWYSFRNIWIFRCMQSHAEHSAVKWESFFSLIMQTEHFNNELSLWGPHCYYNSCASALQNTQRMF